MFGWSFLSGSKQCYIKLVGVSSFSKLKDGNSHKQLLKNEMKFVFPVLCCYHMGGLFMSRPCRQWSAWVVQMLVSQFSGVRVGLLLSGFIRGRDWDGGRSLLLGSYNPHVCEYVPSRWVQAKYFGCEGKGGEGRGLIREAVGNDMSRRAK